MCENCPCCECDCDQCEGDGGCSDCGHDLAMGRTDGTAVCCNPECSKFGVEVPSVDPPEANK